MSTTTLQAFRSQIRAQADVDTGDISDPQLNLYVNEAYLEALGDDPWPFLVTKADFTAVPSQVEYAMSSIAANLEAHRIHRVQSGGIDLRYIPPEQYFAYNPFGNTATPGAGKAAYWTVIQNELLVLWPPPGAVDVRVVYSKIPDALAGDLDTPQTPTRYDSVIKDGAMARVHMQLVDLETSSEYRKRFGDGVVGMRNDLLKAQPSSPLLLGGQAPVDTLVPPRWPWEDVY